MNHFSRQLAFHVVLGAPKRESSTLANLKAAIVFMLDIGSDFDRKAHIKKGEPECALSLAFEIRLRTPPGQNWMELLCCETNQRGFLLLNKKTNKTTEHNTRHESAPSRPFMPAPPLLEMGATGWASVGGL